MTRTEDDKKELRLKAQELIAGNKELQIDDEETTGENDFKFEESPDVCAVVVDKGSEKGFVQIIGGGQPREVVQTGSGDSGCVKKDILVGQTCMLYGRPTVLYIRRRQT